MLLFLARRIIMERFLMQDLCLWKDSDDRKPLLLHGIRRSGKTHLLKTFGETYYENVIYCDFEANKSLHKIFDGDLDATGIIRDLSILFEKDIHSGATLIIFDEIQNCARALESIKLFYERAGQYHIVATASSLAVTLPEGSSVPIEYFREMYLYPVSFIEFLTAEKPMLADLILKSVPGDNAYVKFADSLEKSYYIYQIIGGMPEVVALWLETGSIEEVKKLQVQILRSIEADFIKYAPISMFPKLAAIFGAISLQLMKNNKKFTYTHLKKSWRAKDLEDALYWLIRAGFVYKVEHTSESRLPLATAANKTHFKLYMCDTGLLRSTIELPSPAIIDSSDNYSMVKSALAENTVCIDLMRVFNQNLYYWSAQKPGKAEISFTFQYEDEIVPVVVKTGKAGRSKSLAQYTSLYPASKTILTSMDSGKQDILPLYAFFDVRKWLR